MSEAPPDSTRQGSTDRAPWKETPIMTDFSRKAARLQFVALLTVLAVALIVATGITTGAFVLSFSVLRDLARQGLLPEDLAWIFPAMIDGAIFLSTVAVVVLNKLDIAARDKRFYIALAMVVICISVYGNAYHAYHAASAAQRNVAAGTDLGFTPLSPVGASLIAIIPPFLVLALTHGVGILIKAIGAAHTQYQNATRNDAGQQSYPDHDAPDADIAPIEPTAGLFPASEPVAHSQLDDAAPAAGGVDGLTAPAASSVASPVTVPDDRARATNDVAALSNAVAGGDIEPRNDASGLPSALQFVEHSDQFDDDGVRATARLRLTEPNLTWAEIAARTDVRAASTALRRWTRAKETMATAGFIIDEDNPLAVQEQLPVRELVAQ